MRIDLPICDIKNCRYHSDFNCMADKITNERCPYTILQNEIKRLGYINIYGILVKDENKEEE